MDLEYMDFSFSKKIKTRISKKIDKKLNIWILYLIVAVVFSVLVYYLVNIQLVEGNDYLFLSTALKTDESVIRAQRGVIYDRNGMQLVKNEPSYKVAIDTSKVSQEQEEELISDLSKYLMISKEDIKNTIQQDLYKNGVRVPGKIITISRSVDRDKVLSIYSNMSDLPGIFVDIDSKRNYEYGSVLSHILGYVGEVDKSEIDQNKELTYGDVSGKTGIELYYDNILRGTNGKSIVVKNRDNEEIQKLDPVPAESGDSIKLSIDIEVQKAMIRSLQFGMDKYHAPGGAGILLDVKTGEIIALASLPDFDPNAIISGMSTGDFLKLINDENLPFTNRAISYARPPGSTFKTIAGTTALDKGYITKDSLITTEGCFDLGGGYNFCESGRRPFGEIPIERALTVSSNIFFCKLMVEKGLKMDDLSTSAIENFGISRKTGIDLPAEVNGTMASKAFKEQLYGEEGKVWYPGDSCSTVIGQSMTQVTPIQMATWMAIIANGGYKVTPHIATEVLKSKDGKINEIDVSERQKMNIGEDSLAIIRSGMHQVVTDPWGSAWYLRGSEADPAAKTGSAEVLKKVNGEFVPAADAWVTGFFPYSAPRYSYVIYLQYGGWGFEAAESMRKFLDWFVVDYKGLERY